MDIFFEQYKPASSIANYLEFGSKAGRTQSIGFELEHFVVWKDSLEAVPFCVDASSPEPSVEKVLEQMKGHYTDSVYEKGEDGVLHLFGLMRNKATITLEPGSQLEISIGPAESIAEVESIYQVFRQEIDSVLNELGLQLLELGYHPTKQARDIPLLPKQRYKFMNEHFSHTGKHGICMMRATASTQVSIDYDCQTDALTKFRVANALGPLFAFVTDNTPIFETEIVGALGGDTSSASSGLVVPHRMARMSCWDDTDPERSLIINDGFNDDFSFLRYAEIILDSPGIFLPAKSATEKAIELGFTTFKQILPNEYIDEEMILHILSLFFFDSRFKTYLELRQADSLPLPYALSFAALVSGIFYNPSALAYYADCFTYTDSPAVAFAKTALRVKGYDASVYGRSAAEWLDEMIIFAREGLSDEDARYLEPLAELIKQRKTPLDVFVCEERA